MAKEITVSFRSQLSPPVWKHPSFLVLCFETAAELQRHIQGITVSFQSGSSEEQDSIVAEYAWQNRIFARISQRAKPQTEEVRITGIGMPSYETRLLPMAETQTINKWLKHLVGYRLREAQEELEREQRRIGGRLLNLTPREE